MTLNDGTRSDILPRTGFAILLAVTLPLYYYFFVIGGVIPWLGILLMVIIPELRVGYLGLIVQGLHLLIYAPLLWLLAGWLLGIVQAFQGRIARRIAACLIVVVLLAMGRAPIYFISHGHEPGKSAYGLYISMVMKRQV
jgi:hypothetical protein